jgi:hypothetical protein
MIRNPSINPAPPLRWLIVGLFLFISSPLLLARPNVYLRTTDTPDNSVFLGDTARFSVVIDTDGLAFTGFEVFITFDPDIFEPVVRPEIHGDSTIYRPFIPTTQLIKDNPTPEINDTHGDEWSSPYTDLNGITDFQMDLGHQTAVAGPGGVRSTFSGSGVGAYFELVVHKFPDNPTRTATIFLDNQYALGRQCRYKAIDAGSYITFPFLTPLDVTVNGLAIYPEPPDTVMTPGTDFRISLWDHFASGEYDSSDVTWSIVPNTAYPPGVSVSLVDLESPPSYRDSLIVTTTPTTHGVVDLNIILHPLDGLVADDTVRWRGIVDYPPVIGPAVPATVTFDEDDSVGVFAGDIFTDADDTPAEMTLWLEPDSLIHVYYDTAVDTIYFSADTNWFGTQDVRLYIQDSPGLSIDTLISVIVNPVNDPPVVDFSVLGDTVIIHLSTPDTVDLAALVTDVDNATVAWSVTDNPDPVNLSASLVPPGSSNLILLAAANSPYQDLDLVLTATDGPGDTGSDTLVVSIRSWPPEIDYLPDVRILAGTPDTLSLNELVSDNDTPDSAMTWTFSVVDFADTLTPDPQVTVTYEPATQIAIFNTPAGYAATDLLIATVEDDDSNTDTDTTRLAVFATLSPITFFPVDTIVVYRDSVTDVFDLDDYALDPVWDPEDLNWAYEGGDSLADVFIDPVTHVLTLTTDPVFFGWDSLTLFVSNIDGYSDTVDFVIRVIPRTDGPPVWVPFKAVEIVYPDTIDLFFLTDVCKDDFTTGDQLIFTAYTNSDPSKPVEVIINPVTNLARITVPGAAIYDTWVYFTAEDDLGQVAYSDTLTIHVKDSYSPVWTQIPTLKMETGKTDSSRVLSDYLSDRDTPLANLTITINFNNPWITVTYNTTTTRVTITARNRASDSRPTFTATDPQGNSVSTQMRIIVEQIPDFTPPTGDLSYFFNPHPRETYNLCSQ